jgi:hypothetical protein
MVRLERLGIATAAVATEPFVDEALEQAGVLGMPDYRMVLIPHPVQLLTPEELHAHAERVFGEIVSRLTQPAESPERRAARGLARPAESPERQAASGASSGRSSSA